jgi:DNA (cytosine-5)-methyltransferase 1
MQYGSVCSGIEAVSLAWQPLAWQAVWFSEIEPFPNAVLAHHYPDVPNLGDMAQIAALVRAGVVLAPDILVGGTPCQAFSIAGGRGGLADPRGALTLRYTELADAIDQIREKNRQPASILVWENVPGVLSDRSNAFGCLLGALAGEDDELYPPGAKWTHAGYVSGPRRRIAWRVLDAQYFGLAQRRLRVFLVASARSGFDPAQLLFESESLRGHPASGSEARQAIVGAAGSRPDRRIACFGGGNMRTPIEVAACLMAHGFRCDFEEETFVVVACAQQTRIRRLMPVECERLQGMPDHYTRVPYRGKPATDTPRYKAIGNSMAVPCLVWLGRRLQQALL